MKTRNRKSMIRRFALCALAMSGLALVLAHKGIPQVWARSRGKPVLITRSIDESQLVRLWGNTRPEANAKNDRGRVDDSFPMEHMFLQLKRAPELEQALEHYMDEQQDKKSPNFRHWLMPAELGEKYGLVDSDIGTIRDWLESHGFSVGYVYPTRMVIDFSGNAGQIREAFHTEIHYLDVKGEQHFANMSDPKIPEALAPAVVGIVQMHNFKPHRMAIPRTKYTVGGGDYTLVPADFQTIYNLSPLYRAGIYGQGQTIVVVEDTNSYGSDFTTFQTTFGLNKYGGSLTTVHPNDAGNCINPGTNSDDGEADIDVETVAAIAPGAAVELASCTGSGNSNFGGLIAIENLVSAGSPPAVISMSYGECEAENTATANAAFSSAFESAAAAGVSVFASAGDEGSVSCSPNATASTHGIGVTGWGESVYNVSVGGTDFEDAYNAAKPANDGLPQSTYWSSKNGSTYGSALSYIPEIPWNDSCAGYLVYDLAGATEGYTYCSDLGVGASGLTTGSGSGGPSGCATGTTGTADWVTPTCAGYAKPSWQSGIFGNPADGVRDIPDVSLFASNGIWGHYVVVCWSDPAYTADGSAPCTGAPSGWSGFGGTSISSPTMASIQALVNQKWNIRAGLPTPTYYSIAKSEFGASGNPTCYSINQQQPRRGQESSCVFYDITQGDIVTNCTTSTGKVRDCYYPSGPDGAVSTGNVTSVTRSAGGSGYTTATCAIAAPSNLSAYKSPQNLTLWAGGTHAACTATVSGGAVSAVTLVAAGTGYTGDPVCTISGNGTGATCTAAVAISTATPSYQPAYGATPGWDFATGIGSVNAYNLVFNSAW